MTMLTALGVGAGALVSVLVLAGFVVRRRLQRAGHLPSSGAIPKTSWVLGFVRPYRVPLGLAVLLVFVSIGIDLLAPWSLKILIDNAVNGEPLPSLLSDLDGLSPTALAFVAAAGGLGLVLVNVVVTYLVTYLVGASELRIAADMRATVFRRLQEMSLHFHDRNRTGDLVSRLTDDVSRVRDMVVAWFDRVIPEVLTLVGILVIITLVDPVLTLVAISVVPVLAYYAVAKRPQIKAAERAARNERGELATQATDLLRNVRIVQAFSRQATVSSQFRSQLDRTAEAAIRSLDVSARYSPISTVVLATGTALVSWVGVVKVIDGQLSLGTLVVFLSYLSGVYGPIRSLSRLVSTFAKGAASRDRLDEIFDDRHSVPEHPSPREAPDEPTSISLEGVWFGYDPETPVLRDLDLTVQPGDSVCIVGVSGVGKSTLLSLLLRLYDPTAGSIQLGGTDIRRLSIESLRQRIVLVPQDPWIIDGTVRDNIEFGQAGATGAEFRYAVRHSGVEELAHDLPFGLDTPVGESGVLLSGGQRRRIAVARALIRRSQVLLFDEPTSGLDAASAEKVIRAIDEAASDRTAVVISHDLDLAARMSLVLVMRDGAIVEAGPHHRLVKGDGPYAAMWQTRSTTTRPTTAEQQLTERR